MKLGDVLNMFLISGGLAFTATCGYGQSGDRVAVKNNPPVAKQLNIGDRIPDLPIPDMIDYSAPVMKFSDLKGKYVILDFWDTGCTGCIEAFPKMKELQARFSKDLKVILVDGQSKAVIQNFLALHQKLTGFKMDLPVSTNSRLLMDWFKPEGYPHFVWIDQQGIVRYITQADDVTDNHIDSAIRGIDLGLAFRNNDVIQYDYNKPLYVNGNGGDGKSIICYSSLSHRVGEFPTCGGYQNPGESGSGIYAFTSTIKGLFQYAFNDYVNGYDLPNNRVILNVADTSKYVWSVNGVTQWQNLYNYQLLAPFKSADWLKKAEQDDLMRYFGLEAHMEKRMMKCWVMTADDTLIFMTKGEFHYNGIDQKTYTINIKNEPDSEIAFPFSYIIFADSPHPFVNDIHMKRHADILLNSIDFNNKNLVIQALKEKYRINIRLEDHEVNMLVISEPGFVPDKVENRISLNPN